MEDVKSTLFHEYLRFGSDLTAVVLVLEAFDIEGRPIMKQDRE